MMMASGWLGRVAVVGGALVLTTMVGGVGTAVAQDDVTFTHDVAPILYKSCVSCHRFSINRRFFSTGVPLSTFLSEI